MTGQTYTMIGIEELIDRLESRHQKAIKANVLDTPISVKILGKIVKALRDHKAKIEQYDKAYSETIDCLECFCGTCGEDEDSIRQIGEDARTELARLRGIK